jgi:hypothetical protein
MPRALHFPCKCAPLVTASLTPQKTSFAKAQFAPKLMRTLAASPPYAAHCRKSLVLLETAWFLVPMRLLVKVGNAPGPKMKISVASLPSATLSILFSVVLAKVYTLPQVPGFVRAKLAQCPMSSRAAVQRSAQALRRRTAKRAEALLRMLLPPIVWVHFAPESMKTPAASLQPVKASLLRSAAQASVCAVMLLRARVQKPCALAQMKRSAVRCPCVTFVMARWPLIRQSCSISLQ